MGRSSGSNSAAVSNNNLGGANNGGSDEALRRMAKLVNSLLARVDCGPFREPVDWRGLELWDYPKIIKKMMDLGTVKRKLESNQYSTAAECAADIRLVWTNCKTYNADGSDFYLLAESFSKRFDSRYKKIQAEYDTGDNTTDDAASVSNGSSISETKGLTKDGLPNLESKAKFASNLFRLNGDELGHILQVLDLRAPNAIEVVGGQPLIMASGSTGQSISQQQQASEQVNMGIGVPGQVHSGDEMEINVDAIDTKTFLELDRFIRDKLYVKEKIRKSNNNSGSDHDQEERSAPGAGGKSNKINGGKRKR